MRDNKEDLQKLREDLDELKKDISNANVDKSTNEQVRRLAQTVRDLEAIIATCDNLGKSRRLKRFIQAKRIATQIASVRQSVRDTLQVFQVFTIISIENDVGMIKDDTAIINKNVATTSTNVAEIDKNVVTIDTNVVAISENVMAIDHKVEDGKRYTILSQLKRAGARFDAIDTPSECMDGTRVELLEELIGHMKGATETPASQFTLVCGIPGSGKSTIAKTVAIRLANQHLLAASFFFSRNHATRREITLVFSTIAFQLAQYDREYGRILSKILKEDPDLSNADPKDQLEKLIIHPLSQLASKDREPWIILLDALDECGSDHGDTFLELLLSPTAEFPDHIRFFLTGRPEDPILSAFKHPSIQSITHMHILETTLEAPVSKDIRFYLRQSLSGQWRGSHGWKLKDDDLNALVTRAGGLFIFAFTAVKYIRERALRYDPQDSMNFILRGGNESQSQSHLHQFYFAIVNDAVPIEEGGFATQYRRVLGAVINLLEPLSAAAIADLLDMAPSEVSRVVSLLNSVLLVSEETVRIAHLSFSEYVAGAIRKDRADLLVDGPFHHGDLANSSIRLMDDRLHRDVCGVAAVDIYRRGVGKPITRSLRYACMYWAFHLLEADTADSTVKGLENALEKWLDTNVLFWLEVLSVRNELPRAIRLVTAAQAWYRKDVISTVSTHYLELLSDIIRFIGAFYDMISSAAGHILHSALPFTPSSTELYKTHNRPPTKLFHVIKGVDSEWPPSHFSATTKSYVSRLAFSPSAERIAVSSRSNVEIRSSAELGRLLLTLKGHGNWVRGIAFSADGARIATGASDRTIRIWSSDKGEHLHILRVWQPLNAVAFSPDGARIASASDDYTIRIWSSDTGQLLSALDGHTEFVRSVAFSPDGARIASGSNDCTVRIWSSDKGELLSTLDGHTNWVRAVAFSPVGSRIASGSDDHTIRISDNRQFLSTFDGHAKSVNAVAFSPDSAHIVSTSRNDIRVWSSRTGELIRALDLKTNSVEDVIRSLDVGQQHHTSPPPDSSPATLDLPETEPPKLQPYWSDLRVDTWNGNSQLTLKSGKAFCKIPLVHSPVRCSAQSGSLLVLGLDNGGIIILDFIEVPDVE